MGVTIAVHGPLIYLAHGFGPVFCRILHACQELHFLTLTWTLPCSNANHTGEGAPWKPSYSERSMGACSSQQSGRTWHNTGTKRAVACAVSVAGVVWTSLGFSVFSRNPLTHGLEESGHELPPWRRTPYLLCLCGQHKQTRWNLKNKAKRQYLIARETLL